MVSSIRRLGSAGAAARGPLLGWAMPGAQQVFAGWIDVEVALQGFAPEDHAEEHVRAVGEGDEDPLAQRTEDHVGFDERSHLAVSARVRDEDVAQDADAGGDETGAVVAVGAED